MDNLCACGCGQATVIAKKTSTRDGTVRGKANRYVLGHHIGSGNQSITWKGGRSVAPTGYVRVYQPEHPRATAGYVLEHVLIGERALGKALPAHAEIHHVDENKANNGKGNLVICEDNAYHKLLHQRQRALDACGDPAARRCKYCKQYDNQPDIVPPKSKGNSPYHNSCARSYNINRRHS